MCLFNTSANLLLRAVLPGSCHAGAWREAEHLGHTLCGSPSFRSGGNRSLLCCNGRASFARMTKIWLHFTTERHVLPSKQPSKQVASLGCQTPVNSTGHTFIVTDSILPATGSHGHSMLVHSIDMQTHGPASTAAKAKTQKSQLPMQHTETLPDPQLLPASDQSNGVHRLQGAVLSLHAKPLFARLRLKKPHTLTLALSPHAMQARELPFQQHAPAPLARPPAPPK